MSAPDTNVERQAERHKPALMGIRGAMIFGALMLILMIAFTFDRADEPAVLSNGADDTSAVAVDAYAPGTNQSN
ncbi:MAG: hypothetical protein AB8B60_17960 [Sulfitobacter sp.]